MCTELSLSDPYRILHPNNKEYTYVPSSLIERNRSRLDFFLISKNLFNKPVNCIIPQSLTSTLFDHKPVTISFKGKLRSQRNIVKDSILNNPDLEYHVKSAIFECYLQHWVPGANIDGSVTNGDEIGVLLGNIGRILTLLKDIQVLEVRISENGANNYDELMLAAKRADIDLIC